MNEVNNLYGKRGLPPPMDFQNRDDKVTIMLKNMAKEEDIANQRDPFTPQMVSEFMRRAAAADPDSFEALFGDVIVTGRQTAYRAAEISQSSRTKPDYHILGLRGRLSKQSLNPGFQGLTKMEMKCRI